MSEWISVHDKLPKHGQHVLIFVKWQIYFHGIGDDHDGTGRIMMTDAVYESGQCNWDERSKAEKDKWDGSIEKYLMCGNSWDKWTSGGSNYSDVTHWMPLPEAPKPDTL